MNPHKICVKLKYIKRATKKTRPTKFKTMYKSAYIKLDFKTKQNAATISKMRNDLIETQLKWPYFLIIDLIFVF